MRKSLFILLACCLAATTAFAQLTLETQLNQDKPQDEAAIKDINEDEHGRIFIKINGEPDELGRTPVQIQLENNSDKYEFYLFDHAWRKKALRKERIYFEKGFGGESTLAVENIDLDVYQDKLIPSGKRYTFPDILVEEAMTYECKIPIHLTKPKPNWFCKKKKKLHSIVDCTIRISVENKDEVFDKLKYECDSLTNAFNEALDNKKFCTHRSHSPRFEKQIKKYTDAEQELRDQITPLLYKNDWSKESKKYQRYKTLLDSLDRMDDAKNNYKHDCGRHVTTTCVYCKLGLQEIYNKLNRHYQNLYNGDVQKSEIINEVNALYRCGTTHSNSKRTNGDTYKAGITEFYNKIKNY